MKKSNDRTRKKKTKRGGFCTQVSVLSTPRYTNIFSPYQRSKLQGTAETQLSAYSYETNGRDRNGNHIENTTDNSVNNYNNVKQNPRLLEERSHRASESFTIRQYAYIHTYIHTYILLLYVNRYYRSSKSVII